MECSSWSVGDGPARRGRAWCYAWVVWCFPWSAACRLGVLLSVWLTSACTEKRSAEHPERAPAASGSAPSSAADNASGDSASDDVPGALPAFAPGAAPSPSGPPADPFAADLDPTNDLVVAPPDAIAGCADELTKAGVTFRAAEMPLRQNREGTFTCGANDAVVYQKGPSGLSISPPALMTCRMALAFVRLEGLMQEVATRELGTTIAKVHQVGTYSCRKMVRFDFVSEHSYGNAIDIGSFTLTDGRSVSVVRHFGKLDADPSDARGRFLRELGNAAFDRDVVSVSLGPYWDTLHEDHFHFDMARYRVDGSRPSRER